MEGGPVVDIYMLAKYLGLMPDEDTTIADLALAAAIDKATGAGVPQFTNNAHYDLFILALAGAWYDHRSLAPPGSASMAGTEAMQRLVNQFVLELRYAKDGGVPNG